MSANPAQHDQEPAGGAALAWFYFVTLAPGFLWTLLPRYLDGLGWTGTAIGLVFSTRKAAEMATMGLWAAWADRTGRPLPLLRIKYALGAAALFGLAMARGEQAIFVAMALYGVAMGCAYPLLDALVLHQLGAGRYSAVRSWGSMGFGAVALAVAIFGLSASYDDVARVTPLLIAAIGALAAISTLPLPDARASATAPTWRAARALFGERDLVWLFMLGLLHWAAQTPYNVSFVALCEQAGMGAWVPATATLVGVISEVFVLRKASWLMARARPSAWLLAAISVSALRWLAMSATTSAPAMVALQLLHSLSFGAFLAASIAILTAAVPAHLRATGQATFYFVVFGAGNILGQLATGATQDLIGTAKTFATAGLVEAGLSAAALVFWRLRVRAAR